MGRTRRVGLAFLAGLSTVAGHAMGQEASATGALATSARAGWWLEPSVSLRQTVTTNVRQDSGGRADAVTEISPAVRLQSLAGRWQGSLDYALSGLLYARNTQENTLHHTLSAQGRGELVDRWLFLDARAQIARVSGNALGPTGTDSALVNDNQTETASLLISPSVRGSFGSWADYLGSVSLSATRTKDSPADSYGNGAQFQLASPGSAQRRLGWSLDLSHQGSRFTAGSNTTSDRAVASLLYGPAPDWRLTLRAGREFNDVLTSQREGHGTWGLGIRWIPSPRTTVELNGDDRYFGRSHMLSVEHRMSNSVFSYTDSRDISSDAGRGGALRTVDDLLLGVQATSPLDPIARSAVAADLQNNGPSSTSLASGGFLTTSVSLQRRQQLAFAYTGLRSTLLLSAFRGDASALNAAQSILPGLPAGAGSKQRGLSLSLSRRMSPQAALTLQASYDRSEATQTLAAGAATTRSLSAAWTVQLPQRAALSIQARRNLFDSPTDAYNESALVANLTKRF